MGSNNGSANTASGSRALEYNSTGNFNTANGFSALYSNQTGGNNTASGANALLSNKADNNVANGANALYHNTTGTQNTANGVAALFSNVGGNFNTANGVSALNHNNTGSNNTADGTTALFNNTSGSNNTALGVNAGVNLTTGSNNIDLGAPGVAGESGKIRIGKQGTQTATYVAGIYGKTVASGTKVAVMIDSTGKLGTVVSSARFKEAIKPMDKTSEAILQLKPVTFPYKEEIDPDGVPQFGLIAEQVDKVNPDLVVRDDDGKVNTVRYEAVNAMLLNEFLKERNRMREVEKDLRATVAKQQKQIETLAAGRQSVSNQMALAKAAPQLVTNRHKAIVFRIEL